MDSSLQARVFNKQVGYAKKGMAAAIAAGALWGLNGVLLGFVFHFDPFLTVVSVLVTSIVQAGLHDGFAAIWVILYNLKMERSKNMPGLFPPDRAKLFVLAEYAAARWR